VALDFCDMVGTASNSVTGEAHKRQWLRNVFTDPIGSLPACNVPDEIDEPYVADGAECVPLDASAEENAQGGAQTPADSAENTEGDQEPSEVAKNSTKDVISGGSTIAFAMALTTGFANALLAFA
jgi:hypothetical protein